MKYLKYIAILTLAISCKKVIEIEVPNKTPVLVVDGNMSTDSLFEAQLSYTQNITDNSPVPYADAASIEIFDKDTNFIDVLLSSGKGRFKSNFFKPKANTDYLFRISDNGKEYWASEHMPDTVNCKLKDTSRIIFQGKSNFFQIQIQINDNFQFKNYYGIKLKRIYKHFKGKDTMVKEDWVDIQSIELVLTENPITQFSKQFLLFDDKLFNGSSINLKLGASNLFDSLNQKTTELQLHILSMSNKSFDYNASLNEHLFYQNDPFSQPTLLRGNVSNAYGALVGESSKVIRIKFP
jgi:hypothetical protein